MANPDTCLTNLEDEAIQIFRETVATFQNPVLLYSIGKDSSVLLHLARKAFYPSPIPFPVLHIDTTWKFREMIAFRDRIARDYALRLIVHVNREGVAAGIDPFSIEAGKYTAIMKTEALRQALDAHGFDAAIGGSRRDEEHSRAKERIFSVRRNHRWEPRAQRPELWQLYNTRLGRDQSMRVFPMSNWTEMDVWRYIRAEGIPLVPLYFSALRPTVRRKGALIVVDDSRMPLEPDERPEMKPVRFRSLGCYPLTAAIVSQATSLDEIIDELSLTRLSERQGRIIDQDHASSMEMKKREGYF